MFRGDMGYRYCKSDIVENQEHLEICPGLAHEQMVLNKQILWQRMAPKLKNLADEDEFKELKEKLRLKKEAKTKKKTTKTATKVIKSTTKKTLSDKPKTALRALADKRKKHVLRTSVQSDTDDITPGQEEELPPCTVRACPVL